MAKAAATAQACQLALSTPSLGVGCHVVLVDGSPVSSAKSLRTLAPTGKLNVSLGKLVRAVHLAKIDEIAREIQAEAYAQIKSLQAQGIHLTHIDTHKHTHMFPRVLRPVLRAAKAAGITAIRNPFEPAWAIAATPRAPAMRRLQVNLLRRIEPTFRRIVAEEGFRTTQGAIGVLATGTLDTPTLNSLLAAMPHGTWELVTHPAYNDAALANARTRLLASRETERTALLNSRFPADVELINFSNL